MLTTPSPTWIRLAVLAVVLALLGLALSGCGDDSDSSAPGASISGTVTSGEASPEAGVWVIAETESLDSPYRKIVVTDDEGRYVVPDLPEGDYDVWVRGYGLRDSERSEAAPGDSVDISTEVADPQEAARIYPSNYFLSMFEPPDTSGDYWTGFKLTCMLCHQFGSVATRAGSTPEFFDAGLKKTTVMARGGEALGGDALVEALADWGARIADGEVPEETPPRPEGIERNMVITQWNWGDEFTYAHDEIATDKRDPTLNANGPVWGVDLGNDRLLKLDPETHETEMIDVPTEGGFDTPWCEQTYKQPAILEGGETGPVAAGFGTLGCPAEGGETPFEGAYDNPANPHNPMMDADGKVWMTTQIRREWAEDLPEFCQDDPVILENAHHRQLGYYDPATEEMELIDTCFGTHHLQFAEDGVMWVSGDSYVLGWFDPSKYDPEQPETLEEAQGYSEVKVDSDGDGEADLPIVGFNYGIIVNETDGSIWTAQPSTATRGMITRYDPETGEHEAFEPPAPIAGPRGLDVDSNGVLWMGTGGSGHIASFDRSLCAQTWGPGDQCPEGWKKWDVPGPELITDPGEENQRIADFHYYSWVDQHDTLGLGEDVVIVNGTDSDSLIAFDPEDEQFTRIRIPYPLNTFTRGLDGRIDDPDAGWKGRGLWFTNGLDPVIHSETGVPYIGQVQMRPDPLAE